MGEFEKITETTECLLCGSGKKKELHKFDSEICISKCSNCGFIYTSPRLNCNARKEIYSKGYFHGSADVDMNIDYIEKSPVFKNDADERVSLLKKYISNSASVIELGSAAGFFLNALKNNGFKETGIELSNEMCEYAKNNFNVDCRNEKLEDANIMDSSFDAAALWHTLEHLEAPLQTLKLLSEKLKDNGFIFITVPNFESGNSKANGFAWKHLQPEAHLSHFTPDSLKNILLKAGFETLSLKKSGGTGLLGKESSVNSKIKDFIAANIGKFSFLRKIIKFFAVSLFGKDDFITVVGKKRRND